jgi:O-antigen/teichoic acid export membrane protein
MASGPGAAATAEQGRVDLRHSIIRRSSGVTIAFVIGHAFNFALFWGADRILDFGKFGLFYTAVMTIGIVMSPMMAVTLVLARRFAEVSATADRHEVVAMTWHLLALCTRAAPFVVALGALLAAVSPWLGIEAWSIVLLIPITVLALVVAEILRAALQGMLLFARASALWIVNTGSQFVFSLGALFLFMKVWTGIAGILVGAASASAAFLLWFARDTRHKASEPSGAISLHLKQEIPMIISYSLFILLNNVDILLGYVLLSRDDLDTYAASALLPKAIVAATFAIAQVVLPVVTDQRTGALPFRLSAIKGIAMTIVTATAAAGLLWAAVPFVQGTVLATRGLDLGLVNILAIGAVALSALRVIVVIEISLRRYAIGFAQAGGVVLFALLCVTSHANATQIAELYLLICSGLLILSGLTIAGTWTALSGAMRPRFD